MWFDLLFLFPFLYPFYFQCCWVMPPGLWMYILFCSSLSCLITDFMVIFFPLAHLTQSYWTPVWLVLLMHFLPNFLPCFPSFPNLFVAVSLPLLDCSFPARNTLPASLFPCLVLITQILVPVLSLFFLSFPSLFHAAVSLFGWLVVSDWFWPLSFYVLGCILL